MHQTWTGKSKGSTAGHKFFFYFLKYAGLRFCYFLLYPVVFFYFIVSPEKRNSYRFFRYRLNFSRTKSIVSVYRNFYALGESLIDKLALFSGLGKGFTYQHDGEEHFIAEREKKEGGILISAHIGNWQIAGQLFKKYTLKYSILMHQGEKAQLQKFMNRVEKERDFKVIEVKSETDPGILLEMKDIMEKKEWLVMHADRFMGDAKVFSLEFLGQQARFPAGPFIIASRLAKKVVFAFTVKIKWNQYLFIALPPIEINENDRRSNASAVALQLANEFVKSMEEIVKKYPFQWFNFYDFWAEH